MGHHSSPLSLRQGSRKIVLLGSIASQTVPFIFATSKTPWFIPNFLGRTRNQSIESLL
jgi:hypothetical protein